MRFFGDPEEVLLQYLNNLRINQVKILSIVCVLSTKRQKKADGETGIFVIYLKGNRNKGG